MHPDEAEQQERRSALRWAALELLRSELSTAFGEAAPADPARFDLAALAPREFRTALPGLLLVALESGEREELLRRLVEALTPPPEGAVHGPFAERVAALNAEQRQVVVEWFRFVGWYAADLFPDAERELAGVWFWDELSRDEEEVAQTRDERQRRRVLVLVESAFAETRYPGDDRLLSEHAWDPEDDWLTSALLGKRWQEVEPECLWSVRTSLSCGYLTPEAFCHYLPALLRQALVAPDLDRPDWVSAAIVALAIGPDCPFTPPQRVAVASFLELFRARYQDDGYFPQAARRWLPSGGTRIPGRR